MLREFSVRYPFICCAEGKVSLQGFTDSSGIGYNAVTYVKVVCNHGVSCNLWTGRSRLVLTKDCLMPLLELLN